MVGLPKTITFSLHFHYVSRALVGYIRKISICPKERSDTSLRFKKSQVFIPSFLIFHIPE